ncbi:MAG TPA: hypothetical protein VFQ61_04460 [Polyangiaceae bacterium]|nr:hypothetical protein [Polyangiaceae bacterium]
MVARALAFCLSVVAASCAPYDSKHDAKIPGELLGTYDVSGQLKSDSCGAELLGAPNPWRFDLKLSRFERDLYWLNGREAIVGDIDADGTTFHFRTRIDVPLTPAAKGAAGCIVSRYDQADGKLVAGDGDSVTAVTANLSFRYESKSGSECLEIIGIPGGVQQLPCTLSYGLGGSRLDQGP